MRAASSMTLVALCLAHGASSLESLRNLVVQFYAVGYDHEGPVARHPAQYLLAKEYHGEALAAALGLPEYTGPAVAALARFEHRGNSVVHTEVLMVLSEDLHEPCLVLREKRKVFHQVEQPRTVAGAAQHSFQ